MTTSFQSIRLMLKDILDTLAEKDLQLLLVALEGGVSQLLRLNGDTCIAVHMKANPDITIIEQKGHWIYGKLSGTSGRYERRADGCRE